MNKIMKITLALSAILMMNACIENGDRIYDDSLKSEIHVENLTKGYKISVLMDQSVKNFSFCKQRFQHEDFRSGYEHGTDIYKGDFRIDVATGTIHMTEDGVRTDGKSVAFSIESGDEYLRQRKVYKIKGTKYKLEVQRINPIANCNI